jgi:uncharacterized membrane protein
MDPIIKMHLIVGPLFLFISIIYRALLPKKINPLYGYRTARSMKSQAAWDYANKFSATWMVYLAITLIPFQLLAYYFIEGKNSVLFSAGYFISGLILLIIITELKLKQKEF